MQDINTTYNAISEIKKCKSVTECAVILKKYFDTIYFRVDRTKQSNTYEKMNYIFVESLRQIEKIERGDTE